MKYSKIFTYMCLLTFLISCGAVKEGFTNQKKNNSDEFLVEKKSPLVMPPEYNELPVPQSDKNKDDKSDNSFKNLIEVENKETSVSKSTNKSFEEKILEQIKNN